jgi:hypothetical protein
MPRWLRQVLARIHQLADQGKVRFTHKALRELAALELGLDEGDVCQALTRLSAKEFRSRLPSRSTGEWMYVFKPRLAGIVVYLKVILRANCIVISFHEEAGESGEEDDA